MKTITMCRGIPASGKTTWAKLQVSTHPDSVIRVNKDDLRVLINNNKWSKNNEKLIIKIRDLIITAAIEAGYSVIVDDTNFAPMHETTLRRIAETYGCDFEIVDFHVDVDEAIRRDAARPNPVGSNVIYKMFADYDRVHNV